VNEALETLGFSKTKIFVTEVKFFDYRLSFPTEFFNERIKPDLFNYKMSIDGNSYEFTIISTKVTVKGLRVDTELTAKNMYGGALVLSFYQDGGIRMRCGNAPYEIKEIEVNNKFNIIKITYLTSAISGETKTTIYSFNLKFLDDQVGKYPCEIMLGEDRSSIGLKEELFKLLGYNALSELESRIGDDVSKDKKAILLVHFDNGKVAHCGNKEFKVRVPEGVTKVTSIEIASYEGLGPIKQHAIEVNENPLDNNPRGELGESIVYEKFKDGILNEISKRTEIPKNRLKMLPYGKTGRPDFLVYEYDERDNPITRIAVVEAKYVGDVNTDEFEKQKGRAVNQLKSRMVDPQWTAPYGVVVVICWPAEWILNDVNYPGKVGEFNNPYIQYFTREDLLSGTGESGK